ncbi:MAG: DUF4249 domain-containing protein [Chlorobi bacterium]|nr:DUF4249 domain-containing protein [Chlorobiota bacterium]
MKMIKKTYHKNRMRRTMVYVLLFFAAAAWLQSCTERIDIKLDEEYQKLAVAGHITPEDQYVILEKTGGYFSQETPPPVKNATVTVTVSDNVYLFDEDPETPGLYLPEDTLPTLPGTDYKLSIDLAETVGGQKHFESETTMPSLDAIVDSIRVIFRSDFERWVIKLYAYEPPGPDYYMFTALKNGIPMTDSLQRIGITDDKLVDGMYLPGIYVLFLYEDEIETGDTVTLFTSGISADYFRFLDEAQQELHPNVPFFSGPPANIRSRTSATERWDILQHSDLF